MFSDIKAESTLRLIEVRELLDHVRHVTPKPPIPEPNNVLISKGLFFVHLYGVYEFTVKQTVTKSIELINQNTPKLSECKPLLFFSNPKFRTRFNLICWR